MNDAQSANMNAISSTLLVSSRSGLLSLVHPSNVKAMFRTLLVFQFRLWLNKSQPENSICMSVTSETSQSPICILSLSISALFS